MVPNYNYQSSPFFTNPSYNTLGAATEKQRIKNEIETATEMFQRYNNQKYQIDEIDDDEPENDINDTSFEEVDSVVEPVNDFEDEPQPNEDDEEQKDEEEDDEEDGDEEQAPPLPQAPDDENENPIIKMNKAFFNALKVEKIREYAIRLKLPINKKNKTNDGYSFINKKDLINSIILELNKTKPKKSRSKKF